MPFINTRDVTLAPDYGLSQDNERTCDICRYGQFGVCRLYDFLYEPGYTCESWEEGVQETEHDGVMVALMLPKEIAERVALPDGEPAEELHLTLAYLGKSVDQFGGPAELRLLVADYASRYSAVVGKLNGVGRFNTQDPEAKDPFYATFDSPILPDFRHYLVELLNEHGFNLESDHGFTPHITLTYLDKTQDSPLTNIDPIEFQFTTLAIGWNGRLWSFPMRQMTVLATPEYFDHGYAEELRTKHPDIWRLGGNGRGDEAFAQWTQYHNGENPNGWSAQRRAWAMEHWNDGGELGRIVEQIKWGVIGGHGEAYMKHVVEEAKRENAPVVTADEGSFAGMVRKALELLGLGRLFQHREITDVGSWDGAASQFEDTAAYCDACAINLNSGDRADWTQELCKLPLRGPGDGAETYVRQAVYAAAARFNQLEKPADVDEVVWDSAVRGAAREIMRAYGEMEEEAPETIQEAAREKRQHRDMLSTLYVALDNMSATIGRYCSLHAIQRDDDRDYALILCEGRMWRAEFFYEEDEDEEKIRFGPFELVIPDSVPMPMRAGRMTVTRTVDGRYHYIGVVATPFLNRSGEIDSMELFDGFIEHARTTGEYPRLDFYHFEENLSLGQAYFVDRVGLAYIEAGWFDDTPVARSFAEAAIREPEYWGNSIAYLITRQPELEEVARGIFVPVYRGGVHRFTSLLPEAHAANLFTQTAVQGDKTMPMNQTEFEAFLRGTQNLDEEQRQALLSRVNSVNRAGDSGQYVFRTADVITPAQLKEAVTGLSTSLEHVLREAVGTAVTKAETAETAVGNLGSRLEAVEASIADLAAKLNPVVEEFQNRQADAPAGPPNGKLHVPRLARTVPGQATKPQSTMEEAATATVDKIFGKGRN